jgi:hypothetical protein
MSAFNGKKEDIDQPLLTKLDLCASAPANRSHFDDFTLGLESRIGSTSFARRKKRGQDRG